MSDKVNVASRRSRAIKEALTEELATFNESYGGCEGIYRKVFEEAWAAHERTTPVAASRRREHDLDAAYVSVSKGVVRLQHAERFVGFDRAAERAAAEAVSWASARSAAARAAAEAARAAREGVGEGDLSGTGRSS